MTTEPTLATPSVSRWLRFSSWLGRMWRAFLSLFSPPEPMPMPVSPAPPAPAPPPSGRISARRKLQTPMVVPADGHVFTFQVHATFIWRSEGIYPDQLNSAIEGLMPYAIRRLKALAAGHARRYRPHRAQELEVELQKVLTESAAWTFSWRGIAPTCQPYVWVELDEQVKQAVRPYSERLIQIECEHDVQMRRAEYADKLSRQWTTILTDLMRSPVADGAAEMTQKELAEVVRKIVEEQRSAGQKLEDLMAKKADGNDMFDRSDQFEALLERLARKADHRFEATSKPTTNGRGPEG